MNKIIDIEILKYYNEKITKYINDNANQSKVFVGTQEEYELAYSEGKILVGTLVVILDENELKEPESVLSLLGTGVLGSFILGGNK